MSLEDLCPTKECFRLLCIKMDWKDSPETPKKPRGAIKRYGTLQPSTMSLDQRS